MSWNPARRSSFAGAVDRREVVGAAVGLTGTEVELVEEIVEDPVGLERPTALQPCHGGERRARPEHPMDLAHRPVPVRDQLEDEGRHREIEGRLTERQTVGGGGLGPEPVPHGRRQAPVGLVIRHRQHLRRDIDADHREPRPALDGAEGELTGPGPDIDGVRSAVPDVRREPVDQARDGRSEDGCPPADVALGDPVVALRLVGHLGRMVPCARDAVTVSRRWRGARRVVPG